MSQNHLVSLELANSSQLGGVIINRRSWGMSEKQWKNHSTIGYYNMILMTYCDILVDTSEARLPTPVMGKPGRKGKITGAKEGQGRWVTWLDPQKWSCLRI